MNHITLRERAAIAAMQGLLSSSVLSNINPERLTEEALACADALLKRLGTQEKRKPRSTKK